MTHENKLQLNYFISTKKILVLKPLTVPNTNDISEITKHLCGHISVCKIMEAYSKILQEDNFIFKIVSMNDGSYAST